MRHFIFFLILLACACNYSNSFRINFLLNNTNDFNESVDMAVYFDGKLVNLDTLPTNKVADSYISSQITSSPGKHSILIKSPMYNLRKEISLELKSDTSIIVEYQHNYSIDTTFESATKGYPSISGKRDIIIVSQ